MEYPRSIFLIICTEFCERLSFCGLRTILSLYLRNVLLFHENESTVIYHIFIMFCYLVPAVGAILADSYLGRFRTILYFSIIYAMGSVLMYFAATPPVAVWPKAMTFVGLFLIACGTGGIKPCVAAFGGDQFHLPLQEKYLQQFFSIFYFTINFGGLLGMIFIPILRKSVTCFGDDTCYALCFGFPAALMIFSSLLFLIGRPIYRLKYPKENIILSFLRYIIYTIRKTCHSDKNSKHCLDNSQDKFSPKLISDIKVVLAVLYLYIPLPIFWSLFDQQGSRWTFQASRMNGYIWNVQILPDQMQVINPALVLCLIPLFDKGIYPLFNKICKLYSALNRMIIGGIFAGFAFIVSGFLELQLEKSYPILPSNGEATLNFINTLDCDFQFQSPFHPDCILSGGEKKVFNITTNNVSFREIYLQVSNDCRDSELINSTLSINVEAKEFQVYTLLIGNIDKKIYLFLAERDPYSKSLNGRSKLRFIVVSDSKHGESVTIILRKISNFEMKRIFLRGTFLLESVNLELEPGLFQYSISNAVNPDTNYQDSIELASGGVYILVIRIHHNHVAFQKLFVMTPPNEIHIMWLLPQYILLSIAEIMFAVSGLEFSFTQAPKSMKTITIAAWYVNVAFGNLLVIIVIQAQFFKSQANEFFLFAGLILINMMVFAVMVRRYKFVAMETDSSIESFFRNKQDEMDLQPLIKNSSLL